MSAPYLVRVEIRHNRRIGVERASCWRADNAEKAARIAMRYYRRANPGAYVSLLSVRPK